MWFASRLKNVAIIQARMGSSRLPNKVLEKLGNRTVLGWVVRSANQIPGIDDLVVATSDNKEDDAIETWCDDNAVNIFRGSENDVLGRYFLASRAFEADVIMRLTADCPLLDPQVCGTVLALFQVTNADYTSNCSPEIWPDGLDCEVFSAKALSEANKEATQSLEREHVTPFIHYRRSRYKILSVPCPLPELKNERWTIDCIEDLEFLRAVIGHLPFDRPPSYLEVIKVLSTFPELRKKNSNIRRNQGFIQALQEQPIEANKSYKKSRELLKRATRIIPLGSQTFSKSYVQYPKHAPMYIAFGDGGCVWDVDGNRFVDLVMGLLPVVLGYRDPDIDKAITSQLANGITFSLATEVEIILAEKLIEIIPSADMVRFGKNGTDATSAAIRLARAFTRRDKILACGYHGWQDWYIGATTRNKGVPNSVADLTTMVPFNNLEAVARFLRQSPGEFAAMILEPTNVVEPDPGYFGNLKKLLHDNGVLLIFDEIITGFRFAIGGAQELYDIHPDLSCFGKSMGNGMPISAILGRADIMSEMEEIFFSGTFGGETLSIAASIAVIEKLQREPVIQTLWNNGNMLASKVHNLLKDLELEEVIELVGHAPWKILSFQNHPTASRELIRSVFIQEMLRQGVLISASHNISYAHSEENLNIVFEAYKAVLPEIQSSLKVGNIKNRLNGPIIQPIFSVR
jgi:glutamate-1-semialdehyde 2,1-aminomutase/spore coat polysaccharide biosynthesis protein SpsF